MAAYRNTFLKVNTSNLKYNYDFYKDNTNKSIFAVIKANAYGMGIIEVAKIFEEYNCPYLAVATFDEALILRKHQIKTPILVMGYTPAKSYKIAEENDITLCALSSNWVKELSNFDLSKKLKVHLKVNTSMNRLGHNSLKELKSSLDLIKDKVTVEGIFTHFCCQDSSIVEADFEKFMYLTKSLKYNFKWVHCSNSYNALNLKEKFSNAVRVGIGLYGGLLDYGLKNVASFTTEVAHIQHLAKGESVSYGSLYTAKENEIIAILTVGYADGVLRSDKGSQVKINKAYYPIVGSICMDQMMVKVDKNVELYDEVELFGENISIKEVAKRRNTIDYEVLCTVSNRVKRKYVK